MGIPERGQNILEQILRLTGRYIEGSVREEDLDRPRIDHPRRRYFTYVDHHGPVVARCDGMPVDVLPRDRLRLLDMNAVLSRDRFRPFYTLEVNASALADRVRAACRVT